MYSLYVYSESQFVIKVHTRTMPSICASQTRTFSWAFRTFFSDEASTES